MECHKLATPSNPYWQCPKARQFVVNHGTPRRPYKQRPLAGAARPAPQWHPNRRSSKRRLGLGQLLVLEKIWTGSGRQREPAHSRPGGGLSFCAGSLREQSFNVLERGLSLLAHVRQLHPISPNCCCNYWPNCDCRYCWAWPASRHHESNPWPLPLPPSFSEREPHSIPNVCNDDRPNFCINWLVKFLAAISTADSLAEDKGRKLLDNGLHW